MLFSPDCRAQGEGDKRREPLELLRGPRETAEPGLGAEVGTELKDAAGTAETQRELLDQAPPGPHRGIYYKSLSFPSLCWICQFALGFLFAIRRLDQSRFFLMWLKFYHT